MQAQKISKELVLENMQPFPEGFSLKNLREDMEKEKDKVRLYGTLPTVHACTNAWIHGEGLEDFKMGTSAWRRYRIFLQLFLQDDRRRG